MYFRTRAVMPEDPQWHRLEPGLWSHTNSVCLYSLSHPGIGGPSICINCSHKGQNSFSLRVQSNWAMGTDKLESNWEVLIVYTLMACQSFFRGTIQSTINGPQTWDLFSLETGQGIKSFFCLMALNFSGCTGQCRPYVVAWIHDL